MISLWSPLHVSEVVKEAAETVGRVALSPEFTVTCPVVGVGGSLVGCEGVFTGDDDALFISGDKELDSMDSINNSRKAELSSYELNILDGLCKISSK